MTRSCRARLRFSLPPLVTAVTALRLAVTFAAASSGLPGPSAKIFFSLLVTVPRCATDFQAVAGRSSPAKSSEKEDQGKGRDSRRLCPPTSFIPRNFRCRCCCSVLFSVSLFARTNSDALCSVSTPLCACVSTFFPHIFPLFLSTY